MTSPFHPYRHRVVRLLASLLVVVSLLGNGLALAQVQAAGSMKDCCPEMTAGHGVHQGDSDEGGKPCPGPTDACKVQCLMRCQTNAVLPVVAWVPAFDRSGHAPVPTLSIAERPLADPGPGLRPPIFA